MSQTSEGFLLNELYEEAREKGGSYLRFIDNDNLSSGIYQLKKGEEDKQEPHKWDEIYYILEGEAELKVGEKIYPAVTGSVLYVKAQIAHKFVNIKQDLKVLVVFSKGNN